MHQIEPPKSVSRRSATLTTFSEYVDENLTNVDANAVREFEAAYFGKGKRRVQVFWTLKNMLGHGIERLVLLDRLLFLREVGVEAELVQVFDQYVSPRCVCLRGVRVT